jgi:CRP-like cAMP-binding protein
MNCLQAEQSEPPHIHLKKKPWCPQGLHVVAEGHFDVLVCHPGRPDELLHTHSSDSGIMPTFGELSLLDDSHLCSRVVARTDGVLWFLSRLIFRRIQAEVNMPMVLPSLRQVDLLSCMTLGQLSKLAQGMRRLDFKAGSMIGEAGDTGNTFGIIVEGQACSLVPTTCGCGSLALLCVQPARWLSGSDL